jgi:radical SAM protein with 4Fe4S-binding SPASM domain
MEQLIAEAGWERIPAAIFAELTRRCNLRCKHCYLTDYNGDNELSTREWLDVLDEIAGLGGFVLTISGGEALLRDDLEEIAAHAVELGYFTRLFTNGTLIDEERIKRLARIPWQAIEVSLHGATAQTHEALTGMAGSFAKTLAAARLISAAGITLIMKSNITRLNVHELPAIIAMAKELGAKIRTSPTITVMEDGGTAPLGYRLDDEGLFEALMTLNLEGKSKHTEPKLHKDEEDPVSGSAIVCNAARSTAEIHANGDVTPCADLPVILGNIRLQNFHAIWYNNSRVERLLQLGEQKIPECLHCEYYYYCMRCPGTRLGESGSMLLPAIDECRFARTNWKVDDSLWKKRNM